MHQQAAYVFSDLIKTVFPPLAAAIGKAITVSVMEYVLSITIFQLVCTVKEASFWHGLAWRSQFVTSVICLVSVLCILYVSLL